MGSASNIRVTWWVETATLSEAFISELHVPAAWTTTRLGCLWQGFGETETWYLDRGLRKHLVDVVKVIKMRCRAPYSCCRFRKRVAIPFQHLLQFFTSFISWKSSLESLRHQVGAQVVVGMEGGSVTGMD